MRLLKPLLYCLFLCFFASNSWGQKIYKFKATSFSVIEKGTNGKWGKWSDFDNSTVVISLDGSKDRIVIASQEIQWFKIQSYGEKIITEFEETIPLQCTDNKGGACTIFIVTRKNQDNRKQFYINYADVKIVYNIFVSN